MSVAVDHLERALLVARPSTHHAVTGVPIDFEFVCLLVIEIMIYFGHLTVTEPASGIVA